MSSASSIDSYPTVIDRNGYRLGAEDFDFLGLPPGCLTDWSGRVCPLGMNSREFVEFKGRLAQALIKDNVDLEGADVRMKGSSAEFFSGAHKSLPRTRDEIVAAFRSLRGRFPELFEIELIEERLDGVWESAGPERRPFDSIYRLGIDRARSDYDLQICSDDIVRRGEELAKNLGVEPTREVTVNGTYDFLRKDLVRSVLPYTTAFTILMSDALGRDVSIAVFPCCGPPDRSADLGDLSSHLRSTDWILAVDGAVEDPDE